MSGFQGIMAGPALTVKARQGTTCFSIRPWIWPSRETSSCCPMTRIPPAPSWGDHVHLCQVSEEAGRLVIDGPVRDVDALREMDLPVYVTGSTPGGPHKEGPGEVNVPIACGGISVHPGDIIVADADGIIVVPLKDAPEVLEAAGKFHEQDAAKVEAARNGTSNRAWVRKKLEEKKTEFIDGMYGE